MFYMRRHQAPPPPPIESPIVPSAPPMTPPAPIAQTLALLKLDGMANEVPDVLT